MKIAVHSYQVRPGYASVLKWNLLFEILDPPLVSVNRGNKSEFNFGASYADFCSDSHVCVFVCVRACVCVGGREE